MPKIKITELDRTSGGAYAPRENVVYIPGFSSLAQLGNELSGKIMPGVPTLFTSLEDFKDQVGDAPKVFTIDSKQVADKSYVMAHDLLKLGMYVLYEVPAIALGGTTVVSTIVEMEAALKLEGFWDRLADRGLYDIRFVTSGAYAKSDTGVIAAILSICHQRGDGIALVDHDSALTTKTAVQAYFTDSIKLLDNIKYGAGFSPWVHVSSSVLTGDDDLFPGSFAYLVAFAQSVVNNPSWLSAAGAARGRLSNLVAPYVSIVYGEKEADDLQSRDMGVITVNPICNINPYGYLVWGNRTLNPVGKTEKSQEADLVASNFLNIRNLVSSIKKTLFVASRRYMFEQNSDILWINFKAAISPLLDQMKSSNGIADYTLIKKKSSKKATVTAIIRIVPIEAVEEFDLTVELGDSIEIVTE